MALTTDGARVRGPSTRPGEAEVIRSRFDVHVETVGGVGDLSRVVGVMALLGVTPLVLTSHGSPKGLSIDIQFVAPRREAELCLSRLLALVSVTTASVTITVPGESAP